MTEKTPIYEKGLWLLFCLTIIAIVGESWLLNTTLVIEADSDYRYDIFNDEEVGGSSSVEWINERKKEWKCTITQEARFPYCSFRIFLGDGGANGVDLTRYDSINVWISYRGPAETIRLFLRNSDPAYTRVDDNGKIDDGTMKFHQVEYEPKKFAVPVEVKLSSFNVAEWWIRENQIPPQLAQRELENVASIDIFTGTDTASGNHYFKFHHIVLSGRILPTEQWYRLIIITWLFAALCFLICRTIRRRLLLRQLAQREVELREVNLLLDNRDNELESLRQNDPAVGDLHREEAEQALRQALTVYKEDLLPLSIVLMDVDHFMTICDQIGRDAGDQLLVGISVLVKSHIREGEHFVRWGADEFVLICSGADNPTARIIAEKIRRLVEACDFGIGRHITASFGVASLIEGEGLSELFKRADVALYAAKAVGRNRVCISGDTGPSSVE